MSSRSSNSVSLPPLSRSTGGTAGGTAAEFNSFSDPATQRNTIRAYGLERSVKLVNRYAGGRSPRRRQPNGFGLTDGASTQNASLMDIPLATPTYPGVWANYGATPTASSPSSFSSSPSSFSPRVRPTPPDSARSSSQIQPPLQGRRAYAWHTPTHTQRMTSTRIEQKEQQQQQQTNPNDPLTQQASLLQFLHESTLFETPHNNDDGSSSNPHRTKESILAEFTPSVLALVLDFTGGLPSALSHLRSLSVGGTHFSSSSDLMAALDASVAHRNDIRTFLNAHPHLIHPTSRARTPRTLDLQSSPILSKHVDHLVDSARAGFATKGYLELMVSEGATGGSIDQIAARVRRMFDTDQLRRAVLSMLGARESTLFVRPDAVANTTMAQVDRIIQIAGENEEAIQRTVDRLINQRQTFNSTSELVESLGRRSDACERVDPSAGVEEKSAGVTSPRSSRPRRAAPPPMLSARELSSARQLSIEADQKSAAAARRRRAAEHAAREAEWSRVADAAKEAKRLEEERRKAAQPKLTRAQTLSQTPVATPVVVEVRQLSPARARKRAAAAAVMAESDDANDTATTITHTITPIPISIMTINPAKKKKKTTLSMLSVSPIVRVEIESIPKVTNASSYRDTTSDTTDPPTQSNGKRRNVLLDSSDDDGDSTPAKSKRVGGVSFAPNSSSSSPTPKPSDGINAAFLASLKNKRATVVLDLSQPVRVDEELDHALVEQHSQQQSAATSQQTTPAASRAGSLRIHINTSMSVKAPASSPSKHASPMTVEQEDVVEPDSPASDLDVEMVHSTTDRASAIPLVLQHIKHGKLLSKKVNRQGLQSKHAQAILRAAGIDITKRGAKDALRYLDLLTFEHQRFASVDELVLGVAACHAAYVSTCSSMLASFQSSQCAILTSELASTLTVQDMTTIMDIAGVRTKYVRHVLNHFNRVATLARAASSSSSSPSTTAAAGSTFSSWDAFLTDFTQSFHRFTSHILPHCLYLLRIYLTTSPRSLFWEDVRSELLSTQRNDLDPIETMLRTCQYQPAILIQVLQQLQTKGRCFETIADLAAAVVETTADPDGKTRQIHSLVRMIEAHFPKTLRQVEWKQLIQVVQTMIDSSSAVFVDVPTGPHRLVGSDFHTPFLDVLVLQGASCATLVELDIAIEQLRIQLFEDDAAIDRMVLATHLLHESCTIWLDQPPPPPQLQPTSPEVSPITRTRSINAHASHASIDTTMPPSSYRISLYELDGLLAECICFGSHSGVHALWFILRLEGEGVRVAKGELEARLHRARLDEADAQRALCEYVAFVDAPVTSPASAAARPTPLTQSDMIDLCWFTSLGPVSARNLQQHVQRLWISGYSFSSADRQSALQAAHGEWLDSQRVQKRLLMTFLTSNACRLLPPLASINEGDINRLLCFTDAMVDSPVVPTTLVLFAHLLDLNHARRTFGNIDELVDGLRHAQLDTNGAYDALKHAIEERSDLFNVSPFTREELSTLVDSFGQAAQADEATAIAYARHLVLVSSSVAKPPFKSIGEFFRHHESTFHALTLGGRGAVGDRLNKAAAKSIYQVDKMMLRHFLASKVGSVLFYHPTSLIAVLNDSMLLSLIGSSHTSSQEGCVGILFELLLVISFKDGECFERWEELTSRIASKAEELADEKKQCWMCITGGMNRTLVPKVGIKKVHIERLFQIGQADMDTYDLVQGMLSPVDVAVDGGVVSSPPSPSSSRPTTFQGIDELIFAIRSRAFGTKVSNSSDTIFERRRTEAAELVKIEIELQKELERLNGIDSHKRNFRTLLQESNCLIQHGIESYTDDLIDELFTVGGGSDSTLVFLGHAILKCLKFSSPTSIEQYLQSTLAEMHTSVDEIHSYLQRTEEVTIFKDGVTRPTREECRHMYIASGCGPLTLSYLVKLQAEQSSARADPSFGTGHAIVRRHAFTSTEALTEYLKSTHLAFVESRRVALATLRAHLASLHCTLLPTSIQHSLSDDVLLRLLAAHDDSSTLTIEKLILFESVGMKFEHVDQLFQTLGCGDIETTTTTIVSNSSHNDQSANDSSNGSIVSPSTPPSLAISERAVVSRQWSGPRAALRSLLASSKVVSSLRLDLSRSDVLDELLLMGGGPDMTMLSIQVADDDGLSFQDVRAFESYLQQEHFHAFDSIRSVYDWLISAECSLFADANGDNSTDGDGGVVVDPPSITLDEVRQLYLTSACGKSTLTYLRKMQQSMRHSGRRQVATIRTMFDLTDRLRTQRLIGVESRVAEKQMLRSHLTSSRCQLLPKSLLSSISDAILIHLLIQNHGSGSDTLKHLNLLEGTGVTFTSFEQLFQGMDMVVDTIVGVKEGVRSYLNSRYCTFFETQPSEEEEKKDEKVGSTTTSVPFTPIHISTIDCDLLFSESAVGIETQALLWNFAFHGLVVSKDTNTTALAQLIEWCRMGHANLLARNQRARARLMEALTSSGHHFFTQPVICSGRELDALITLGGGLGRIDSTIRMLLDFVQQKLTFPTFDSLYERLSRQVFQEDPTRAQVLEVLLSSSDTFFRTSPEGVVMTIDLVNRLWTHVIEAQPILIGVDTNTDSSPAIDFTPSPATPQLVLQYLHEFRMSHTTFESFDTLLSALLHRMYAAKKSAWTLARRNKQEIEQEKAQRTEMIKQAENIARMQGTKTSTTTVDTKQPLPPPVIGNTKPATASTASTTTIQHILSLLLSPDCYLLKDANIVVDVSVVERLIYFADLPSPDDVLHALKTLADSKANVYPTIETLISSIQWTHATTADRLSGLPKVGASSKDEVLGRPATAAPGSRPSPSVDVVDEDSFDLDSVSSSLHTRLSVGCKVLPLSVSVGLSPASIRWLTLQGGGTLATEATIDAFEANGRFFNKPGALGVALRREREESFNKRREIQEWLRAHAESTITGGACHILPVDLLRTFTSHHAALVYECSRVGSYTLDYLIDLSNTGRSFKTLEGLIFAMIEQHRINIERLEKEKVKLKHYLKTKEMLELIQATLNLHEHELIRVLQVGGNAANTIRYLQELSQINLIDDDDGHAAGAPSSPSSTRFRVSSVAMLLSMLNVIHRESLRAKRHTFQFFKLTPNTTTSIQVNTDTDPTIEATTPSPSKTSTMGDNLTLPPLLSTSINLTKSDVEHLFTDVNAGVLTLPHLECLQEFGVQFPSFSALLAGVRAAQRGPVARQRASRRLIQGWMTSPACKTLRAGVAASLTDEQLDAILAFAGPSPLAALLMVKSLSAPIGLTHSPSMAALTLTLTPTSTSTSAVTNTAETPTTKATRIKSAEELIDKLHQVGRASLRAALTGHRSGSKTPSDLPPFVFEPAWRSSLLSWLNSDGSSLLPSLPSWSDSNVDHLLVSTSVGRSIFSYLQCFVKQSRCFETFEELGRELDQQHCAIVLTSQRYLTKHMALIECVDEIQIDSSNHPDNASSSLSWIIASTGVGIQLPTLLVRCARQDQTFIDLKHMQDTINACTH